LRVLAAALLVAVASITSVAFFADRVGAALVRDAHQLLGADLVLVSDHPWQRGLAEEIPRRGLEHAESTTFISMAMAGDGQGGYLLDRNPLKGLPFPRESTPRRPIVTDEQYQALLGMSRSVSPLFELALVLAHETGHRIGSIRLLRWSDVDVARGTIRWRAENDKIGFEHETIATSQAMTALERARQDRPSIGDAWVLPSPGNPAEPCSRHLLRDWWQRGEALAGIPHAPGSGWHSLRRKFATELKHVPLKDLCYLGGWKEPQTVLRCYQRPDETTMREALAGRRRLTGSADS